MKFGKRADFSLSLSNSFSAGRTSRAAMQTRAAQRLCATFFSRFYLAHFRDGWHVVADEITGMRRPGRLRPAKQIAQLKAKTIRLCVLTPAGFSNHKGLVKAVIGR